MTEVVKIERLGHQGDGIGHGGDGPVYVAGALPGETWQVTGEGQKKSPVRAIETSPDRAEPVCRHFEKCGGCLMQHLAHEPYLAWKRSILETALAREGIKCAVDGPLHFPIASRRRALFTAISTTDGIVFGFSERASHEVVDVAECPILLPVLQHMLPDLRAIAGAFHPKKRQGRHGALKITAIACDNGLDISIRRSDKVTDGDFKTAATHPVASKFLRISLNGETLIERERPFLTAGIARITLPPNGFVQAVGAAEEAIAGLVSTHLDGCKHVADLFSGSGAFALRLAEKASVLAAESDATAINALEHAWRETGGKLKQIKTERRDLFRRPLMADELRKFEGVVIDPPRAGAEAQSRELAKSPVRKIASVSCNPQTLARDLRILVDGGYKLKSVTAIDQFVFTPHLEAVALLEK